MFYQIKEVTTITTRIIEENKTIEETKDYLGLWITGEGYIRHRILPQNRYDEAHGNKTSPYRGSYVIMVNHIDYKDDTGFTANGEFSDGYYTTQEWGFWGIQ